MVPRRIDPLERWLATKARRNCLPQTLRRYRRIGERATAVLQRGGRPRDPKRWDLSDALVLKEHFHGDPWTLGILSDFVGFFGNPAIREAGIPPKGAPRKVRWLSREEAELVVQVTSDDPALALIVVLGLGQGLRRVEWKRLRVDDVDLEGGRILVRGKGRSTPKLVWSSLHPAFSEVFLRYLRLRQRVVHRFLAHSPGSPVPPEVFIHPYRGRLRGYSDPGFDLFVARIERRLRQSGLDLHLSSHMFRRTGATLLEEALLREPEGPVDGVYRVVQGFLRHESISTTMRYLESNPGRQRTALERYRRLLPWPKLAPGKIESVPETQRRGLGGDGPRGDHLVRPMPRNG
jgi:integrase